VSLQTRGLDAGASATKRNRHHAILFESKTRKQQTKLNVILTDTPKMAVFDVQADARAAYEMQHVIQWQPNKSRKYKQLKGNAGRINLLKTKMNNAYVLNRHNLTRCPKHAQSNSTTLSHTRAVPRLRPLVAGLSSQRPGFDPHSVYVGFVVDKVTLRQVFPPSTSVFTCQFHSNGAPLLEKKK
jgi:hypothetical protein